MRAGLVVIGCSSGGMAAVARLLAPLPKGFRLPIAIAQHRARESDETLASVLQRSTRLIVREPQRGGLDRTSSAPAAARAGFVETAATFFSKAARSSGTLDGSVHTRGRELELAMVEISAVESIVGALLGA